MRQRLIDIMVQTGAFTHSPKKPFVLSSGRTSPYYFDMRRLNAHPEGLHLAARLILDQISGRARSVGGMEAGAIPLVTAVSLESRHTDSPLLSFYVRKSPKTHGTARLIEGMPTSPCIIIDDVITTGSSVLRALKAASMPCTGIHTILFRGTQQDRMRLEQAAPLHHIFTQEDIINC